MLQMGKDLLAGKRALVTGASHGIVRCSLPRLPTSTQTVFGNMSMDPSHTYRSLCVLAV